MDAVAANRWRTRVRTGSPWLHEEVASRMVQRLPWFREKPASWLHWEPENGGLQGHRKVSEYLPQARCHVSAMNLPQALEATRDPAKTFWKTAPWVRNRQAMAAAPDTRVAMLWANMALHLEPMPQTLLRRWSDRIDVNGFLMFSCLGPDSLRELRQVYRQVGWPEPAHAFTDMHDWGDMLVHSGFAEPVMDMERITLSYSGAPTLLADLRDLGRNLQVDRFRALRGHRWRDRLMAEIEAGLPRDQDGRLLLTFEIIYGHAFKPQPRSAAGASQSVPVDKMRAMLRATRR